MPAQNSLVSGPRETEKGEYEGREGTKRKKGEKEGREGSKRGK
jgi:hypothetical protein